MSQETSTWLNQNTLIGFTDKRGHAWHYRATDQGAESNHYTGAIPVEDIRRRLFFWKPIEGTLKSEYVQITEDGVETIAIVDPTRKTIIRPDTGAILGVFKGQPGSTDGYKIHDFEQWLIENVEQIVDANADEGLDAASAGLLKGGAVGWVQFETPETLEAAGYKFRPFLTAATSLDGSLSSTYNRGVQAVVCDNTLSAALGDSKSLQIKVKHSRNSLGKLADVRQALEIVHQTGDDFARQVEQLTNETVTDAQFAAFLEEIAPTTEKGEAKTGRGLTLATNKQATLTKLWHHDNRVSPWKNTVFGVVQCANTYRHHEQTVKGSERSERNAFNAVTGANDREDQKTLELVRSVL